MNSSDDMLAQLKGDLVERLRVLGGMFTDLANDEGAERLLSGLVAEDSTELQNLLGDYGLPQLPGIGTCVWVRSVLDSVLTTPNVNERCTLRTDLTADERLLALAIAARYSVLIVGEPGGQYIAPGPLLDELEARHLVTCGSTTTHSSLLGLLGPYERFCV